MVFAVVNDNPDILQWITCDGAFIQHLANAFFHRRNKLRWNRAAYHFIDEFEAVAAIQRFHFLMRPRQTDRHLRSAFYGDSDHRLGRR